MTQDRDQLKALLPGTGWLLAARAAIAEVVESAAAQATTGAPLISVVIPTYQHAHLVSQAVSDALAQHLPGPHEVIVVDDGSTDGTDEVLQALVRSTPGWLRYVRLRRNLGRSTARNAGIALARGDLVAFTDSDCCPTPTWLAAGIEAFTNPAVGVAQGHTLAHPSQPQPFFSHFIETKQLDGTFCTSNAFYRRGALIESDGFDPAIAYWQDADLGWRVQRSGWQVAWVENALVYHQVLPISPRKWLSWPLHFTCTPAMVARYNEHRQHLFLRLWVNWFHALCNLAALSILLGLTIRPEFLLLGAPYVIAFPFRHGLKGRFPPLKAAFHLAWDAFSCTVLVASSARHRTIVL